MSIHSKNSSADLLGTLSQAWKNAQRNADDAVELVKTAAHHVEKKFKEIKDQIPQVPVAPTGGVYDPADESCFYQEKQTQTLAFTPEENKTRQQLHDYAAALQRGDHYAANQILMQGAPGPKPLDPKMAEQLAHAGDVPLLSWKGIKLAPVKGGLAVGAIVAAGGYLAAEAGLVAVGSALGLVSTSTACSTDGGASSGFTPIGPMVDSEGNLVDAGGSKDGAGYETQAPDSQKPQPDASNNDSPDASEKSDSSDGSDTSDTSDSVDSVDGGKTDATDALIGKDADTQPDIGPACTKKNFVIDNDGDLYANMSVPPLEVCEADLPKNGNKYIEAKNSKGADCDDGNQNINPAAAEICNKKDDNCNKEIDEGLKVYACYPDDDDDGYGLTTGAESTCQPTAPPGMSMVDGDCNDDPAKGGKSINPGAADIPGNGIDEDCDGKDAIVPPVDNDKDGYVAGADCNDNDKSVNPGEKDLTCNNVDDNCDGKTDEGYKPEQISCGAGDCLVKSLSVCVGGNEIKTCTPKTPKTFYPDFDNDGYGLMSGAVQMCEYPADGKTYITDAIKATDCDDTKAAVNPNAKDTICDGADNNCNGKTDEDFVAQQVTCGSGDCLVKSLSVCVGGQEIKSCTPKTPQTYYPDFDNDGYGLMSGAVQMCAYPADGKTYITDASKATDCNDNDKTSNPGKTEVCDGKDNDCDGKTDNNATDEQVYWKDTDGDGYADMSVSSQKSCVAPGKDWVTAAQVKAATDCNDNNSKVNPGLIEMCNTIDDDCDGTTDQNAKDATTFYFDGDKDGFGVSSQTKQECVQPLNYTPVAGDCNDADPNINPGAKEICNGKDDNCNKQTDTDATDKTNLYPDLDGDGYGDAKAQPVAMCADVTNPPKGYSGNNKDCDDGKSYVHPDAVELLGLDSNCDGQLKLSPEKDAVQILGTGENVQMGSGAVLADIDGDGLTDVVVGDSATGCMEVILGKSKKMVPGAKLPMPQSADVSFCDNNVVGIGSSTVAKDLNGDGKADLIFGMAGYNNSWDYKFNKLGDGSGTGGALIVYGRAVFDKNYPITYANLADPTWAKNKEIYPFKGAPGDALGQGIKVIGDMDGVPDKYGKMTSELVFPVNGQQVKIVPALWYGTVSNIDNVLKTSANNPAGGWVVKDSTLGSEAHWNVNAGDITEDGKADLSMCDPFDDPNGSKGQCSLMDAATLPKFPAVTDRKNLATSNVKHVTLVGNGYTYGAGISSQFVKWDKDNKADFLVTVPYEKHIYDSAGGFYYLPGKGLAAKMATGNNPPVVLNGDVFAMNGTAIYGDVKEASVQPFGSHQFLGKQGVLLGSYYYAGGGKASYFTADQILANAGKSLSLSEALQGIPAPTADGNFGGPIAFSQPSSSLGWAAIGNTTTNNKKGVLYLFQTPPM